MRGAGLPFIDAGHHQYDTFCDLRLARLLGEIGESSEKHAGKAAPRRTDQGHAGHPRGISVLSSKSAEAGQQTSRGAKCGTSNRTSPESAHLIVVISSNADRFIIVVVRSDHADLPATNPGSLKPGHGTCCLGMGIEQSADCLHLRPGPMPVRSVGPLLPGFELFRPDASSSRQSSPQREPAGYVPQPGLRSNPGVSCLGPKSDQLGRAEAMPSGDGRRLEERVQMLSQTQKAQNGDYDHDR
ncbi:hypothetical protein NKH49_33865, partial [Mesorhizobium sp. M1088]|uniref:hypothetical protein n=1 Tax=Mesorhizobium sp. M1088 TaxID=2957056 RepID=UPI003338B901